MGLFGRKQPVVEEPEETVEEPTLPEPPPLNADGLRSFDDHLNYLLSLVEPLRPFGMPLLDAWDQVVCEDINSTINVPPNSTSKIDGYAVRASDLRDADGNLTEALALSDNLSRLGAGEAFVMRVGEVLPRGATAMLPASFGRIEGRNVRLLDSVEEGAYLRAAGEHLAVGTRLLSEGEVLDDRLIGMLASSGIDRVLVRPRPRVVVVSSGAGLVEPGAEVRHGESNDANSFLIAGAARAAGATVFRVGVHTDDLTRLKAAISDQLIRADLIISTTSGRREDYEAVSQVMRELGAVDAANVAMSPGRTQTFGLIGEQQVPMVMMPGNPVSAYVSFQAFGWPLIRQMMGAYPKHRRVRAIAAESLRSMKGKLHLLRGEVYTDSNVRRVSRVSDPHAMAELARSNALILLDEETEEIIGGQTVPAWLIDEE